jgi:rfaE bifunctional protein nucleotidyltransferase chain/domain
MEVEMIKSKIFELEPLKRRVYIHRFWGNKIVFTNGCFDILHLGHIDYLSKAKSLGDFLIIGLNTDLSVRKIKGEGRPVTDQHSRAVILASLRFVDAVILFDEETPYNLIKEIKPDVLVKGSDYLVKDIAGSDVVSANGGKVVTIDFLEGYSTSSIISKIKNSGI